jgi:hypothetical protein
MLANRGVAWLLVPVGWAAVAIGLGGFFWTRNPVYITAGFIVALAARAVFGLATGQALARGGPVSRGAHPVAYWFLVGMDIAGVAAFAILTEFLLSR